jgi:hypothetical protein
MYVLYQILAGKYALHSTEIVFSMQMDLWFWVAVVHDKSNWNVVFMLFRAGHTNFHLKEMKYICVFISAICSTCIREREREVCFHVEVQNSIMHVGNYRKNVHILWYWWTWLELQSCNFRKVIAKASYVLIFQFFLSPNPTLLSFTIHVIVIQTHFKANEETMLKSILEENNCILALRAKCRVMCIKCNETDVYIKFIFIICYCVILFEK